MPQDHSGNTQALQTDHTVITTHFKRGFRGGKQANKVAREGGVKLLNRCEITQGVPLLKMMTLDSAAA